MAKIRFGHSDDFTAKNGNVGVNTANPQKNLEVVGVTKGKGLTVSGVSSLTAYEGFLKSDYEIAENTTLSSDQGPVSSLSGEIIVGTGQTVTVSKVEDEYANANNGTVWSTYLSNSAGGFQAAYPASNAFNGKISATETSRSVNSQITSTWTPPKEITYSSSVEVWTYYAGSVSLNGGTAITVNNDQSWRKISGGSGTLTSITFSSNSGNSVYIAGIAIDGEILVDGFSTLVDKGARAGGSEIECLKVFNTFTPPSGGTNDRPYAPKPGELYYNYDIKTIEFHDGYQWRQVDYTSASGRALFSGGYTDSNVRTKDIQLINIPTLGNATRFGDLARNLSTDGRGVGSQTRAVFMGGYGVQTPGGSNGRQDDMDYVTIASEGNAIDFGNLSIARNGQGSVSSSTRGLMAGGATNAGSPGATNCTNAIEYIEISTLGDAVDFGDLLKERSCSSGVQSSTRGVFGAGDDYHHPAWQYSALGELDYINMASKGNTTPFGFDIPRIIGGAAGNDVRGCFAGGYLTSQFASNPATYEGARAMTYVTISSTGNAQDFGNLTMGYRIYMGGAASKTRGIWTGGSQYPVHHKTIDYIQFASLGDSQDFGDLTYNKGYMTSSTSDSHGGLGGF